MPQPRSCGDQTIKPWISGWEWKKWCTELLPVALSPTASYFVIVQPVLIQLPLTQGLHCWPRHLSSLLVFFFSTSILLFPLLSVYSLVYWSQPLLSSEYSHTHLCFRTWACWLTYSLINFPWPQALTVFMHCLLTLAKRSERGVCKCLFAFTALASSMRIGPHVKYFSEYTWESDLELPLCTIRFEIFSTLSATVERVSISWKKSKTTKAGVRRRHVVSSLCGSCLCQVLKNSIEIVRKVRYL